MQQAFRLLIAGDLVDAATTFDVINPASGKTFALCPEADRKLLNHAVAEAKAAFAGWLRTAIEERAAKLDALAAALE